ncbi:hypothetical protein [Xylophilus sp.]|uniref:hypothetical protein n=1 Tax=Xylophilus sp. TaxID=2653893 RepID=UPI002D807C3F|nr:hypothetical protein [Xylophilus sp.]
MDGRGDAAGTAEPALQQQVEDPGAGHHDWLRRRLGLAGAAHAFFLCRSSAEEIAGV